MATATAKLPPDASPPPCGSPEGGNEPRRPNSMRMSAGGGGSLGIESASSLKALLLQQLKHHGGFIPHDNASTGGGDNLSEGGETSDSDCSTAAHSIGRNSSFHHGLGLGGSGGHTGGGGGSGGGVGRRSERRRIAFRSPIQLAAAPLDSDIRYMSSPSRDVVIPVCGRAACVGLFCVRGYVCVVCVCEAIACVHQVEVW